MPLLKDLWVAANGGKNTSNTSHLTHASVDFFKIIILLPYVPNLHMVLMMYSVTTNIT